MEQTVLLMGGNIGDVRQLMESAATMIEQRIGSISSRSTMVETAPWGFEGADVAPFVNQALIVDTELSAEQLLDQTQSIERELGRDREAEAETKASRGVRYLSRTIDIDIIFYGEQRVATPRLTIPHPLMHEREFVLGPIVEIAPEWHHAELGVSCGELLDRLKESNR